MATSFLDVQNNIENYLLRTDINTMVQLAINRAIQKYSKQRLWFTETSGVFNTIQGQWFYDAALGIPDNIRQIDYLRITVNNVFYEVYQRDIQYIIDANVNGNQGQPIDYAWYDEKIYFYPVPQQAYPITVFFQIVFDELVFPTDFNSWTNIPEACEVIECEALRWLYDKVILDAEKAAEYKVAARDALRVLNEINEGLTGQYGSIRSMYW